PYGEKPELCRAGHAEQNAIIQAAINGSSTRNAVMYCTHQPCSICAKMIINAEIRQVFIANTYPDELCLELFQEADIELILLDPDTGNQKRIV
ncbi:MAG: deaminase, partial [Candidatus Cloacimonetes bacterium]|nr:deaminase [Candidatus Cloacimonadota bacterium]